ncbi:MAG: 3-phosphoshikimate 1-carboxyvinyltransferase [Bacteroidota bacterium]|jgi:3-phosphoshikimate 1-carboxyvinyltransferase
MQRELLLSVVANSPTRLHGNFTSLPDDVLSAIKCIELFGATVLISENRIEVIPPIKPLIEEELTMYVGESGFLIRNLISIGFLFARKLLIHAKGTLLSRELHVNGELLDQLGLVKRSNQGEWPLILEQINPCHQHIQLDASATSQIASGVLIRLAKSTGERSLCLKNLVSTPYLEMTVNNLMYRGVNLSRVANCISFDDNCQIQGRDIQIDGDWSGAANLLCIGAITNEICIKGLRLESNQADEHILDILTQYGAQIEWNGDVITVKSSGNRSFNCDVTNSPDLFPLLCVLAASASGTSIIKGTQRLMYKESDRLKSSVTMLSALGVAFEIGTNEIQITGGIKNHAPYIDTYNDHRLVLAAIVASTISDLSISLSEVDSVEKSFPEMKLYL